MAHSKPMDAQVLEVLQEIMHPLDKSFEVLEKPPPEEGFHPEPFPFPFVHKEITDYVHWCTACQVATSPNPHKALTESIVAWCRHVKSICDKTYEVDEAAYVAQQDECKRAKVQARERPHVPRIQLNAEEWLETYAKINFPDHAEMLEKHATLMTKIAAEEAAKEAAKEAGDTGAHEGGAQGPRQPAA